MPPRPYQDNPFVHSGSRVDVDDYYHQVPPAHSLSAGLYSAVNPGGSSSQNIPLAATPRTSFSAASTHNLASGYGMSSPKYAGIDGSAKSSRKKWIVIGSLFAIAGIITAGVVAGVLVSRNSKHNAAASNSGKSGSSSSPSSSSPSSSSPSPVNPNDPSNFPKNSAFSQSFYGIAYTPANSQLPGCGNSLEAVIADIQILSQLTKRIRMYGADCNQATLVLEAINQTKVDMKVWLANYPVATDNGAAYVRQRNEIQQALQTYGASNVGGIVVGNEFMLNYLTDNNIADPNSAAANVGAAILIPFITDTKSMLKGMGLSLKVGNSDAGAYFNNEVLEVSDFAMANVHPWFGMVSITDAAAWTWDFFEQNDVALLSNLTNKPDMYIAETGWPTQATNGTSNSDGASIASVPNLQIFLDTFVCQANANGTAYFFFELADEEWKNIMFGGVEGWWGVFNQNLTLKAGLKIPNCPAP